MISLSAARIGPGRRRVNQRHDFIVDDLGICDPFDPFAALFVLQAQDDGSDAEEAVERSLLDLHKADLPKRDFPADRLEDSEGRVDSLAGNAIAHPLS